jgi:hypothetical protein
VVYIKVGIASSHTQLVGSSVAILISVPYTQVAPSIPVHPPLAVVSVGVLVSVPVSHINGIENLVVGFGSSKTEIPVPVPVPVLKTRLSSSPVGTNPDQNCWLTFN